LWSRAKTIIVFYFFYSFTFKKKIVEKKTICKNLFLHSVHDFRSSNYEYFVVLSPDMFLLTPVFGHRDNPASLKRCPRVVVISYTMLRRLRKSMLQQEWAFLIVDESHHVRCSKKPSELEEVQTMSYIS